MATRKYNLYLLTSIVVLLLLGSCISEAPSNEAFITSTLPTCSYMDIEGTDIPRYCLQAPADGMLYHGVYPGGDDGCESDINFGHLDAYQEAAGLKAAWVYFSHNWYEGHEFPWKTVEWIDRRGSVPYIRLMLRDSPEQNQPNQVYTLEKIIAGEFDEDFLNWFEDAREFGKPILVEFGVEMNGGWFPWNARWNGAGELDGFGDPTVSDGAERFVFAYRHIIDLSREVGAHNISWQFHINHSDHPDEEWNRFESYYPGDAYIDLLAVSIYGAQTPNESAAESFRVSMDRVYQRLTAMAPDKQIIIAEFGNTNNNPNTDQANWARSALEDLLLGRWERVIGFSWWNEHWQNDDVPANDTNMRVQDNPALRDVFRELLVGNQDVLERLRWEVCP